MIVIFDKRTWVCTVIIDHSAYFNFKSYYYIIHQRLKHSLTHSLIIGKIKGNGKKSVQCKPENSKASITLTL